MKLFLKLAAITILMPACSVPEDFSSTTVDNNAEQGSSLRACEEADVEALIDSVVKFDSARLNSKSTFILADAFDLPANSFHLYLLNGGSGLAPQYLIKLDPVKDCKFVSLTLVQDVVAPQPALPSAPK